jgi:hypothetical protein
VQICGENVRRVKALVGQVPPVCRPLSIR